MNIGKKIISILLCVIFMCSGMTIASFAADEMVSGNFTYTVSSGKVTIVGYPETGKGSVTIPSSIDGKTVVAIDDGAFQACTLITEVIIPDTVTSIGKYAFAYCVTLETVTIPSSVTFIGKNAFQNSKKVVIECESGSYAETYANENGITTAEGGSSSSDDTETVVTGTYEDYVIGAIINDDTAPWWVYAVIVDGEQYKLSRSLDFSFEEAEAYKDKKVNLTIKKGEVIKIEKVDIAGYNLGEETYSFENFGDEHSDGHCFGMSATSAGYYLCCLAQSNIGDNTAMLYSFSRTKKVSKPICHYQKIQGPGTEYESIVAGGNIDLNGVTDTKADWDACVDYVKNHKYDNAAKLNIGMWFKGGGGHAVNFLYYKEVDGQQRIYAYDNNFPDIETYYYMAKDGLIHQAPRETKSSGIIGLDLMDVENYFSLAEEFKAYKYVYADKNEILVEGATFYYMKCGSELGSYVMYQIPDNVEEIKITPIVDNATFTYCENTYSFDSVDSKTYGVLKPLSEDDDADQLTEFEVVDAPQKVKSVSIESVTMDYKSSKTLTPEITATDGAEYTVTYSSDSKNVTVDENGKIYGAKKGSANITVTVTDTNGNVVTDTCKVTVEYAWWQWLIKIVLFGWIWY